MDLELLLAAFGQLMQPQLLLTILVGVTAGLLVGAMPGLTATMALAVLLPFTFAMDALQGLVALGAVYMGAIYGGAFAAILVNTPGTPSSIATTFDGYPMAKAGRALEAISAATIASVIGGVVGVIALLLLAPPLARLALLFGPAEYFWVAILGLTLIASLSGGSLLKGLLGGTLGLLIGTIGVSPIGGETRFTFGLPVLQGGIELIVALIGLFVLPELLMMAARGRGALSEVTVGSVARSGFVKMLVQVLSMPGNLVRSCIIGQIIAVIPGAGGSITSLVAYNEAKRASKHPERFGKGAVEGLVASESSNNVMVAGSMVPLLTLGVPGAPPDAVILGVLMLHGLRPGLELFTTSGMLAYGFILSMGIAALAMLPVGLLGGRLVYQIIVKTPYYFLVPGIALITVLGTFALRNSITDVLIMFILGVTGFLLKDLGIDAAPVVLGLILGVIAEMGFVQSLLRGAADPYPILKLFQNPLSWVLITITILSVASPYIAAHLKRVRDGRSGGTSA